MGPVELIGELCAADSALICGWRRGENAKDSRKDPVSARFTKTVKTIKPNIVLALLILLFSLCCSAQNVYSLAIYSAGTSYRQLCSYTFPLPLHRYRLTELSWYEDDHGFVVFDMNRRGKPGTTFRRALEVVCGPASFTIPLGPIPPDGSKPLSPNPTEVFHH